MFSYRRYGIAVGIGALLLVLAGLAAGRGSLPDSPAVPAYNPDNLIRLHVVAPSDTDRDQQLKMEVRNVVLAEASKQLKDARDVEEARHWLAQNLATLTRAAEEKLSAEGSPYPVKAQWGDFDFPTRTYGSLVLPQGRYEAVRLIIGEGKGENWWCVLFPPLCLVDVADGGETRAVVAPLAGESYPQERRVELRFKIIEVLQAAKERLASLLAAGPF
ncbi:MAG: stage II sporulation protein R [Thermoanaerobacteraceae bacterium]|nr:stage II sporulation protein R [Thermoanaerobacteraceae bacterium]